ncbi:endosome protein [Coprinopsis cinerea AmutBmut pab1-1]|nr:endosome protein [Coprinopsis cinerea AmutBmut pab1-1]
MPLDDLEHIPDSSFGQNIQAVVDAVNNVRTNQPFPAPTEQPQQPDALLVLLPLLIVLSTFLFLLLTFLICVLLVRRRRGIMLRDNDGPVDMSREELIEGEGGFEGVESRWLEGVSENVAREYLRARDYQLQYPPNSLPTDITLSQFLSIQEKGVSAWSFEPDYETVNSLLVHARTEITFLPDPASASCVQSNLPLPKLNEVYYWEVKMFDLPETTTVSVGLATKPYPPFRLPGQSRYSVGYHSNGDKSHNYPFTATPFGPVLKEGDVLGVGYRPRTGTVFFTRNGRKMEDAFIGLSRWNLFPTIGADGPCSVHVNLGQAGFVFIEANVKKWGLAPSVGTLAPPPAYGSERGSILLDVGGRVRSSDDPSASPSSARRSRRRPSGNPSSPLRVSSLVPPTPLTPPPPITPIDELPEHEYEVDQGSESPSQPLLSRTSEGRYSSPPSPTASTRSVSPDAGARNPFTNTRIQRNSLNHFASSFSGPRSELTVHLHPPPESPLSPNANPPTPHERDIHLQALPGHRRTGSSGSSRTITADDRFASSPLSRRDPPAYSPLDAYTYADGVHVDLPAEVIAAAIEGNNFDPSNVQQQADSSQQTRRR